MTVRILLAPLRLVAFFLAAWVGILLIMAGEERRASKVMDFVLGWGN